MEAEIAFRTSGVSSSGYIRTKKFNNDVVSQVNMDSERRQLSIYDHQRSELIKGAESIEKSGDDTPVPFIIEKNPLDVTTLQHSEVKDHLTSKRGNPRYFMPKKGSSTFKPGQSTNIVTDSRSNLVDLNDSKNDLHNVKIETIQ